MKRKIIKQGHNTLTITLPTEWVKRINLKAGDEIDLYEKEGALIVNGSERPKDKSVVINIDNFTIPLLWRYFQGAYRSGCTEIKIVFDPSIKEYEDAYHYYTAMFDYSELGEKISPKPAIAMIQGVVDRFIGMGIIESGKNYCLIKEMGSPTAKEFDNSLRRIFLIILQMFDRIIEAIEKDDVNNVSLCKEIHTIDLNIDRLSDYCCRILNCVSNSYNEDKKILLFPTLFILELLGDEFKYMGKHIAISKKSVKDTLSLAQMVKEHFNFYYQMFYKFDRDSAIRFGKKDIEVYKYHFKIKEKIHGHSRSIARHLMMISKFSLVLSELKIEMTF